MQIGSKPAGLLPKLPLMMRSISQLRLAFSRRIFAYPNNSCYRSRSNGGEHPGRYILLPLQVPNSTSLVNRVVLLVWISCSMTIALCAWDSDHSFPEIANACRSLMVQVVIERAQKGLMKMTYFQNCHQCLRLSAITYTEQRPPKLLFHH
jgi:hypothetical protein